MEVSHFGSILWGFSPPLISTFEPAGIIGTACNRPDGGSELHGSPCGSLGFSWGRLLLPHVSRTVGPRELFE